MTSIRVQVIGGGPGGLLAARLVKLRHPRWHVEVHERRPAGTTFGFGIGLTQRTLRNVAAADLAVHDALQAVSHTPQGARLHTWSDSVGWGRGGGGDRALARTALLEVLHAAAAGAGVKMRLGSELHPEDADADLVVGADGAGSATRQFLAEAFGASAEPGPGLYIWCGLDKALDGTLFAPAHTAHGVLVAHAYPYAAGRSTLLVETDEQTWRRAGLDKAQPPDDDDDDHASDQDSLAVLQQAFAPHLAGARVIGNRSRWQRFRTVRCERWAAGSTVLIGDAARTVHYSLGSGTKLALEDAIALARALGGNADVPASLKAYEADRRPASARIEELARRSQAWWDDFPDRTDQSAATVAFAYLTRGGALPLPAVAEREPDLARAALAAYAGCPVEQVPSDIGRLPGWVLTRPYRGLGGFATRVYGTLPPGLGDDFRGPAPSGALTPLDVRRDAPAEGVETALIAACRSAVSEGAAGVLLGGPPSRSDVLDRLALAERVRRETSAVVAVSGPMEHLPDLVDGLVAGRTDLVSISAG